MAPHSKEGVQQAGLLTVRDQRFAVLHSDKADFHTLLCHVVCDSVLHLSMHSDGGLDALARAVGGDGRRLQLAVCCHDRLAFHILLVEFQGKEA